MEAYVIDHGDPISLDQIQFQNVFKLQDLDLDFHKQKQKNTEEI